MAAPRGWIKNLRRNFMLAIGIACMNVASALADDGIKGLAVQEIEVPIAQQAALLQVKVGRPQLIYELGESFEVEVSSRVEGHLYLFYIHSDDSVNVLFPNAKESNNEISAGKSWVIPGINAGFRIGVVLPLGTGFFKAIVTKEPLDSIDVARIPSGALMLELQLKDITVLKQELTKGAGVRFGGAGANEKSLLLAEHSVKITTVETGRFDNSKRALREKQRFVFAVGVGQQKAKQMRDFAACASEAAEFGRIMKDDYAATTVVVLTDEKATVENIRRQLREMSEMTLPGDEVIIYWSGHGGQVSDPSGDEADHVDEFLVTYDTDLSTDETKRETSVTDDQLGRWLQDFQHCEVLAIFDTCFSGGQAANEKSIPAAEKRDSDDFAKSVPARLNATATDEVADAWEGEFDVFTKDITQKQAMVISSSRAAQKSFVRRTLDNSVLTYYLLQFLRDNRGRHFNPEQMFEVISKQTAAYVLKTEGPFQQPVLIGKEHSDIQF